jgi:hypothetical protein
MKDLIEVILLRVTELISAAVVKFALSPEGKLRYEVRLVNGDGWLGECLTEDF